MKGETNYPAELPEKNKNKIVAFFYNLPTAHKLGLGLYWNILFLIPLLLFYHPHKSPRNLIIDWTTLFFYIVAISFSYLAVIIMVLGRLVA